MRTSASCGGTAKVCVKNGKPDGSAQAESYGCSVWVIADGAWGFAASNTVTRGEVDRVVAQAVAIAKASATLNNQPLTLAPVEPVEATYRTPIERDPLDVALDEKLDYLAAPMLRA